MFGFDKEIAIKLLNNLFEKWAVREIGGTPFLTALFEPPSSEPEVAQAQFPSEPLAPYLALSFKNRSVIRSHEDFMPQSKVREEQVIELVTHLFVRYPVPLFLYRTMLSYDGLELVFDLQPTQRKTTVKPPPDGKYRPWFKAVARGDSFAFVARDIFTKREAHWYLQAPGRFTIEENMYWARAAAIGVPRDGCDHLVSRFGETYFNWYRDSVPALFRFYAAHWSEMTAEERIHITDFLRAKLGEPGFCLKGRTLASVRRLSEEWHGRFHLSALTSKGSWKPRLPEWSWVTPERTVIAKELTNSRELHEEGGAQQHCVSSYAWRCSEGATSIVSFRQFGAIGELTSRRLTIEVTRNRAIVQIRGRSNRRATEEEMILVRQWANETRLTITPHA